MSEDPLGFDAGDNNISRYSANDPINYVDRNGLFSIGHAWNKLTDAVGDAFEDVGDFFSDQWDNGNIQKGLLAAGTLASGGMLGFGLASGSLMGTQILAGGLGFASGLSSSYEVFSGNRIGDGSFTRYLGAAAAVTGGFYAAGVSSFGTMGRTLSGASGLISGYEIASGDVIGDGTLSSLFHVSNLGVNQGGTMFSPTSSNAQRFGVGLNLAVGTASVFSSGDRSLQQSLRALSIASGVWNTTSSAIAAKQSLSATVRTIDANRQARQTAVGAVNTSSGSGGSGRRQRGVIRLASGEESDEGAVVRADGSDNVSRLSSDYSGFEEYLAANPENSPIGRRSPASIRQDADAFEGWLLTRKYGLKSLQIAGPIRIIDLSRDQPPVISDLTPQQLESLKPFLPPSDREVEDRHANAVRNEAQWLAVQAARIRQERLSTISNPDDLWANLDYMEAGQVPLTANFRRSFYEADYVISSEHNQTLAQAQYATANLMEMPIHGLSMLPGGGVAKVAVYHLSGESQDPLSAYFEVVGSLAPFALSKLSNVGKPISNVASFADDIRPLSARFSGTATTHADSVFAGVGAPSRNTHLLSDADLLKSRIGPAYVSHPGEYDFIMQQLADADVEIVFRPGSLAYSPATGAPGRMILDPQASLGALRHEYKHFLDIRDAAYPGIGPYLTDPKAFARLEVRGYMAEVQLAREIGHSDLVPEIVQQMKTRVKELLGK
jgi:hypothetical protein